ncbi:MAG: PCYCGC motif-containing (lipo)protein [Rubrivivax sp.]
MTRRAHDKRASGHRRSGIESGVDKSDVSPKASRISPRALLAAMAVLVVAALVTWFVPTPRTANTDATQASAPPDPSGWKVGMLRADGLRIVVSGRDDASAVLDAEQFSRAEVRNGYRIAAKIPALLNRLYCWCGCENRGEHRSNLQCFEDGMAEDCVVCLGTAETAYEMSEKGITDPAKIQAAVDVHWAPGR